MENKCLCIFIIALAATGCHKTDLAEIDRIPVVINVAPLKAQDTDAAPTRASLNEWTNTGVNMAYGTSSPTESLTVFSRSLNARVSGTTTSFEPKLFYPDNGDVIYLKGYHPRAPMSGNTVKYTITGEDDIMISNTVYGSKTAPIAGKEVEQSTVTYRHLLSQFHFTVQNDGTFPIPVKLKQIRIDGVHDKVSLDLFAETLTFDQATTKSFEIFSSTTGVEILTTVSATFGHVMLGVGDNFKVVAVLSIDGVLTEHEVSLPAKTGSEAGKYYKVNIMFSAVRTTSTMTCESWKPMERPLVLIPSNLW